MSFSDDKLTVSEVAQILGVSDRTVRNYCNTKALEHYRIATKIYVSKEDLEKFIKSLKVEKEK